MFFLYLFFLVRVELIGQSFCLLPMLFLLQLYLIGNNYVGMFQPISAILKIKLGKIELKVSGLLLERFKNMLFTRHRLVGG